MNHEELVVAVLDGLVAIAGALPGCEVMATMFPTEDMKQGLAKIYAEIINFLVRAYDWFASNRILRALHSMTKSRQLQYDDILKTISKSTSQLRQMAAAASQAEIRDMHILQLETKQEMPTQHQVQGLQLSLSGIESAMSSTSLAIEKSHSQITATYDLLVHVEQSVASATARIQEKMEERQTALFKNLIGMSPTKPIPYN